MSSKLEVAGDECVCACHRDPSIKHVMACCADCTECGTRVRTAALDTHRPERCGGFHSGRTAVRVDAVVSWLAALAFVVAGIVAPLMPLWGHVVAGALVGAWCWGLLGAPNRWPLRAVLAVAIAVNLLSVVALVIIGILVDGGWRWAALVAAVVVAAFAVWEWLALRQTQGSPNQVATA